MQHRCKRLGLITARLRRDPNKIISAIQTYCETNASNGRQTWAINQYCRIYLRREHVHNHLTSIKRLGRSSCYISRPWLRQLLGRSSCYISRPWLRQLLSRSSCYIFRLWLCPVSCLAVAVGGDSTFTCPLCCGILEWFGCPSVGITHF